MTRVAVIGAGIAGLTAAEALSQGGFDVVVWDKGARPGGRASSRVREAFEFDHGAQYFTARDRSFQIRVRDWIENGIVAEWTPRLRVFGGEGNGQTDTAPARYVGIPRMSAVAAALSRDLDVRSGVRIARLDREDGQEWILRGESNQILHRADVVLVTLPPAQVVPLLESVLQLAEQVTRVVMRPCWAVLVGFERALDPGFDAAFVNDGALSWIARNSSKPGRGGGEAWVLHAAPSWSERHEGAAQDDVTHKLVDEFLRKCELPRSLAPVHSEAHWWRWAIPDPPLDVLGLFDEEQLLGTGGDWCGKARIEGAWASGLALAERVTTHVNEVMT